MSKADGCKSIFDSPVWLQSIHWSSGVQSPGAEVGFVSPSQFASSSQGLWPQLTMSRDSHSMYMSLNTSPPGQTLCSTQPDTHW